LTEKKHYAKIIISNKFRQKEKYSMAEFNIKLQKGDKVIVKGNGVAVEEGVIEYVGKYFITYKGPAYLKTVNEFDYNNGRIKIEKID
jgi:hypothetical protein